MRGARHTTRGPSPELVRPARRGEGGFTLVELVVVVGIVALLVGVAAPALGSLTGANARDAAGQLAGGMRYLFDTAALRRSTCRLALDPASRAWWAECTEGRATVEQDPEARRREEEDLADRFEDEKDAEVRRLLGKTRFGAFSDRLAAKRALPGRTAFGKIHVEGRALEGEGTAYVYFFPGGRAQRAVVPVVDGSNVYSIVVEPFTGRARVVHGPVEVKE